MLSLTRKLGINSTNETSDRPSNFTGREWGFRAIYQWLSDPTGSRYFLLTGEPGAGKTAISDRLTQFSQSADPLHPDLLPSFLRAIHHCSARDSTSIDPKTFARAIALQLAQHIPSFAQSLKDTGEKQVNIQINQSVGAANDSSIQALVIHNLDLSGIMTTQEAFNWVVLNPLHAIYQAGFDQPITILVDALDEALIHEGDRTIVDLLANLEGLPPQVRFILTSRKVPQVENKFLNAVELNLSAPEFDIHNQADIRAYIQTRISQAPTLSTHLSNLEPQLQESAIDQVTQKSDGNFLYVRFLLDAIEQGERSLTNLEGLPEGLDGLYYESLERVVTLGKQNWRTTYAPIIGVLSVARTSLTLSQLQAFTQQAESAVWQCLGDLRQFLEELEPQPTSTTETSYRLYHQSVVDFLRVRSFNWSKNSRHNPYYLPPQEFHQQIAHHYWQPSQALETLNLHHLDSYGYDHLTYHLFEGDRTADLHQLLTASPQWMEAKFIHCQGDAAYAADLDLSISSFADPLTPAQLLHLLQLHTARQVVAQRVNRYDDVNLRTLVWLDRETEALNQVRLRPQTQQRFWGLFLLHKLLLEKGEPCADLLTELQTTANIIDDPKAKAIALGGIAHAHAKAGQQSTAQDYFADAQQLAHQVDNPAQQAFAIKELVASLAQTGYFAEAEAMARTIASPRWQAWSLATLGTSLAQSGQPQAAAPLFAEAEAIARTLPNEYDQS
ncbi:hypothetical protein [Phormidium tenue]|uniref:Orc1-like AAA ATPase domain-containing protein n=1 Tax=Phormidium tenue NIES-30 TaxID=549789 RepID=A0A1U7IZA7_9CYAN|nr:hypothetical protein [Phormidium tenue]MBD2234613.1 hypothetical protein [Phormidium tenue FACHB-1052]OKH44199.1 hypothetical protein NIES30_23150 [Phormidium tenue NIES-30]